MADIVINPSVGKIDFFTNRGDQNPANTARLTGNTILFTGPLSASSISTGGGGAFVTSVQPTANYLSKFTGNSTIANSLIYDNGTNVGIGTSTPLSKLQINTTIAGSTVVRADGTSGTLFSVVDDLTDSLMSVNNSAGLPVFEVFADDRIVGGQYGVNDFVITNNRVGIGTSNPLAELHVTSSTSLPSAAFLGGNVGVGTTSPIYPLDIPAASALTRVGSALIGSWPTTTSLGMFGNSALDQTNAANYALLQSNQGITYLNAASGQSLRLRIANTDRLIIDSGGNVGIGTTSFVYGSANRGLVELYGSSESLIALRNSTGNLYIQKTSSDVYINNTNSGVMSFATNNTQRMVILAGGSVSFGSGADILAQPGNIYLNGNTGTANGPALAFGQSDSVTGCIGHLARITGGGTSQDIFIQSQGASNSIGLNANPSGAVIYFQTQGAEKVRITAAGNVGIGTSTPATKLDIYGPVSVRGTTVLTTNFDLNAGNAADIYGNIRVLRGASLNDGMYIGYGGAGGNLKFFSNSGTTEFMTIATTGNVGIGSTSPAAKLDIVGTNTTIALSFGTTVPNNPLFINTYGSNTGIGMDQATAGLRLVGDYSGASQPLVDIGYYTGGSVSHANWVSRFKVVNSGATVFTANVYHSIGSQRLFAGSGGTHNYIYTGTTTLNFVNAADNSTLMTLLNGGSVGIGTTSPLSKLDVRGNLYVNYGVNGTGYVQTNGSDSDLQITTATNLTTLMNTGGSAGLAFGAGNSERMRITSGGNIGIGTTTTSYKLTVNGDLAFNGGLSTRMLVSYTNLTNGEDWANSPISIRERDQVGNTQLADKYAPNLNFHWANRASKSVWMDANGMLNWGEYDASGIPAADGTFKTAILLATSNVGIGTTSPTQRLEVAGIAMAGQGSYRTSIYGDNGGAYLYFGTTANTSVLGTIGAYGGVFNINSLNGDTLFLYNSSEKMRITTGGNVGIGTTSASRKLIVFGDAAIATNSGGIVLASYDGDTGNIRPSVANGSILISDDSGLLTRGTEFLNAGGMIVQSLSGFAPLEVKSNGNTLMYVTSGGNVGIGTTSPLTKLDVRGVIQTQNYPVADTGGTGGWVKLGTLTIPQNGYTAHIRAYIHAGFNALNSQDYYLDIFFKTSNASSVDANGFAGNSWYYTKGYTTSDPAPKWVGNAAGVSATAYDLYLSLPAFTNRSHYIVEIVEGVTWANVGSTGQTNPGNGSSTVCVSSLGFTLPIGSVGIGSTAPACKLDVAGTIRSSTNEIYGFGASDNVSLRAASTSNVLGVYTSNTERLRVDANGNLGIGTSTVDAPLHIYRASNPWIRVNGGGAFSYIQLDDGSSYGYLFKNGTSNTNNGALAGAMYTYTDSGKAFQHIHSGTPLFTILSGGNVGIGTTAPATLLQLSSGTPTTAAFGIQFGDDTSARLYRGNSGMIKTLAALEVGSYFYTTGYVNAGNGEYYPGSYGNTFKMFVSNVAQTSWVNGISIVPGGNVGIGTTSPLTLLDVRGGSITAGTAVSTSGTTILAGYYTSGTLTVLGTEYSSGGPVLGYAVSPSTSATGAFLSSTTITIPRSAYVQDGGTHRWYTGAAQTVAIGSAVSTSERMRINSDGNLGIGTSTPRQILHLNGSILLDGIQNGYEQGATRAIGYGSNSGAVSADGFSGMDIQSVNAGGNYSQNLRFWTHHYGTGTGNTPRMVLQYNGNLGIGTTAPSATLTVIATNNTGSRIQLGTASNNTFMDANKVNDFMVFTAPFGASPASVSNGGAKWGIKMNGSIDTINTKAKSAAVYAVSEETNAGYNRQVGLALHTSGFDLENSEKVRITAGGNVGIGTTNPATLLHVDTAGADARIRVSAGTNTVQGGMIANTNGLVYAGSITNHGFSLRTNDTDRVRIQTDGNVGIGTTSAVSKLHVNGGMTFGYGSDATFFTGTEFDSSKYLILQNNTDSYGRVGLFINAKTFNGANTPSTNDAWSIDPRSGIRFRGWLSGDSNYDTKFVIQHLLANATNAVGDLGIFAKGYSTTLPAFVLAGGGNVGIGTTSAKNKFAVIASDTYAYYNRTEPVAVFQGLSPSTVLISADANTNGAYSELKLGNAQSTYYTYSAYIRGIQGAGIDYYRLEFGTANGSAAATRMIIATDGNVGIGTTSPGALLNIRASTPTGTGTVTTGTNILLDSNTSNYITFRNTSDNGTYAGLTFLDNNTGGYIVFRNYSGDVATGSDCMIYGSYQDHIFQNSASETINGKTETMRIKSSGYVGINTNNPTARLQVVQGNSGGVAAILLSSDESTIQGPSANTQIRMGSNLVLNASGIIPIGTNGSEKMRIQSDGNVGIGTTSPIYKLHVVGNSYVNAGTLLIDSGNSISWGNSTQYIFGNNGVGLTFVAGSATRMFVSSTGNVGIGTTTPSGQLHVNSTTAGATVVRADGTSGTLFSVVDDLTDSLMSVNNSAGLPVFEVFADDRIVGGQYGANDFVITNNRVGIGTSNPLAELHVTGSASVPAAVFYGNVGIGTSTFSYPTSNRGLLELYGNADALLALRSAGTNFYIHKPGVDCYIVNTNSGFISIYNNGSERIRIKSDGNVGIGTSSPLAMVHVESSNSQGDNKGLIYLKSTSGTNVLKIGVDGTNNFSELRAYNPGAGDNSKLILQPYGGDVGIGVTSPTNKLEVSTGADDTVGIRVRDSVNGVRTEIRRRSIECQGGDFWINGQTSWLELRTGNTSRLYIGSNGNVGIGSTSPGALLDVNGSLKCAGKFVQNSTTQSITGTNQTLTLNVAAAAVHIVSMASGATITTISYSNRDNNPAVNTFMLVVKYAGTASITFTNVIWANGATPTLTGTNAFADVFMFTSYQGGAGTPVWIGTVVAQALVSTNL